MVSADFLAGLFITLLQLFAGFAFSVSAVFIGITLFDKLTGGTREWDLIKKGNLAAGVLYAAIIFSLVLMIQPSIESTVMSISATGNVLYYFAANVVVLVISLLIAVLLIYILLRIINMMTEDVEQMKEIHKGNVSVALVTASALLAVSFVMQIAIKYLVTKLTSLV